MKNRPLSVSATLLFIILNALIWLALGVIIALHAHPAIPDDPLIRGVMAILSVGAAAILLGLFFLLARCSRIAWFIALGVLAITCLLAVFDDFGWSDLVVLVINIIPIILMIKDRAWYLQRKQVAP